MEPSPIIQVEEQGQILDYVYSNFDTEENFGLSSKQLQIIHENIRGTPLSLRQIEAAMEYVCACGILCDREEMLDVLKEMDRRYFLANDLQWEFALLDRHRKGAISKNDAQFLFQMVYGEFFSKFKFERMIQARLIPTSDITFDEIEVELCNIPTYDWIEELRKEEAKEKEDLEFKKRVEEKKQQKIEEKLKKEEEEKRIVEEEEKRLKEMLKKKEAEELELKRKKEEEERLKQEELENERKRKEAERAAKKEKRRLKELELQKQREEAEKQKREEKEEKLAEPKEEEIQPTEEQTPAGVEEPEVEQGERGEVSEKEKEEMAAQRALENWKKARDLLKSKFRQDRLQALQEAKAKRDAEEAAKEEENADAALEAESRAQEELQKAELAMQQAESEEEKKKAQEAKEKAEQEALKNKENRLRLSLRAAVKLRKRPKIDVTVVEAKEAEIPALDPDIEEAEKVSDSLKCGEELEDAMVKRNLAEIETAVKKIEKKRYEKDHVVALSEADKLKEKLKRLEKLRKEILALDQRTISEIRSYKTPIAAIHQVMIATYIILGYNEKELKSWKFIQALLGRTGKEGLKRMCTTLEASKIDLSLADVADKKYLRQHDLATITDISAGAATFYVWSTAMIDEARSWHEDSDFRKRVEEKRKEEEEEARRLQEQKQKKKGATKTPGKTGASTTTKSAGTPRKVSRGAKPTGGGNRTARSRSQDPKTVKKSNLNVSQGRARSGSPKTKRK